MLKLWFFFFFVLSTASIYAQFTDVINSNRPGESMSAFSVGKTIVQGEAGIYAITEDHDLSEYEARGFGLDFALRYGAFMEELEIIANIQYQTDQYDTNTGSQTRSAVRRFTIGGKYLLYDPAKNYEEKVNIYSWKANHRFKWRQIIPAISVYAGANINFSNNPYTFPTEPSISPKLMLITQNQFGKFVFVTNIIADKFMTDYPSYGVIGTLTLGLNQKWSAFVEGQGYKSDFYSDAIARGGAAYLIQENLQVDASISKNIKETPSILYGGIGVSWRFDANYKDILIRKDNKDEKDKDKKSKKDKKKEEKKRIDEVEGVTE